MRKPLKPKHFNVFMPPISFQSIRSTHVSRLNFSLLLGRVQQLIHDADFVALDTRLTGAHSATWRNSHVLDTCDITYHKLKYSAENFAMWQFGLCPFKWMEAEKKYVAQPCNFYLFPRDELKVKLDDDNFLCQTTFLESLAKNGFDFNMCIRYGLSHISREQESMAGDQMEFQSEDYAALHMVGNLKHGQKGRLWMSPADLLLANKIRAKLTDWIKTMKNSSGTSKLSCDTTKLVDKQNCTIEHGFQGEVSGINPDYRRWKELITSSVIWYESCESPHLARASLTWDSISHRELQMLLEVLSLDCKDLVVLVQPEALSGPHKKVQVFYTTSHEDKILLMEELGQRQRKAKERKLADAIGFRHIIDALVDTRKVIVGHQCILDFSHIYKSFFKPLPSTTSKFTAGLLENFPCIFDTKYIMMNIPQLESDASTSLPTIYLKLFGNHSGGSCRVKVEISDKLSANETSTQHKYSVGRSIQQGPVGDDAASGAFMAGCLFTHIYNLLNTDASDICSLPKALKLGMKTELGRFTNLLCMNDAVTSILDLSTGCQVADKLYEQ